MQTQEVIAQYGQTVGQEGVDRDRAEEISEGWITKGLQCSIEEVGLLLEAQVVKDLSNMCVCMCVQERESMSVCDVVMVILLKSHSGVKGRMD